jgi:prepilin peptidase CpaA
MDSITRFFEYIDFPNGKAEIILLALALATSLICAITDLRKRKIYNVVLLPSLLIAVAAQLLILKWTGLKLAFIGLGIGFGFFFLLYCLGGVAPGDVKLAGTLGAFLGGKGIIVVLLYSLVAAGVIAIAAAAFRGKLGPTLYRLWRFLYTLVLPGYPTERPSQEQSVKIPLAAAFVFGLAAFWLFGPFF